MDLNILLGIRIKNNKQLTLPAIETTDKQRVNDLMKKIQKSQNSIAQKSIRHGKKKTLMSTQMKK